MRRAGVLEDVRKEGHIPKGVCWREFDGTFITGIKSYMEDPDVMVCLPLDKLIGLYYRHLQKEPTAVLKFAHKVVGIEHDEKEARVVCETLKGRRSWVLIMYWAVMRQTVRFESRCLGTRTFPERRCIVRLLLQMLAPHFLPRV
jgi:2-polyprenyl-6-methoxyphenol hydroxylase-like FAD-dependent oxidoreductase